MNKVKFLQWLVVLLVLFNLSTIGSIIYHNYQEKKDPGTLIIDSGSESRLNGRYFKQTLEFDNAQMDAFRLANRAFQPKANMIIYKIDSLKNEIYSELKKETSDTILLNQFSKQIGEQHIDLKKETNRFYLKIKKVCSSDQKQKLDSVFSPLFKNKMIEGQGFHRRGNTPIHSRRSGNY